MKKLLALLFVLVCGKCFAQLEKFSDMRYLAEIGHLDPFFGSPTSLKLAAARVTNTSKGVLLEGRNQQGRAWRALLDVAGGVGQTVLWEADFDRNGRKDLMIAAYFPPNGRCLDPIDVCFLMFDSLGLPVPWAIRTRMPVWCKVPRPLLVQVGKDGPAELVGTTCEYSQPPRFGEDRQIIGVYGAKNAHWQLTRPADMGAYTAVVRANYSFRAGDDVLLPANPSAWIDSGNAPFSTAGGLRLTEVIGASPDCRGVRIPIVDGRVERIENDPRDELGKDRLRLSDGRTCFGWPVVVIDRRSGREIIQTPGERERALKEIAKKGLNTTLAGQTMAGQCSPTVLSAREE
jgi:hypothetical protein